MGSCLSTDTNTNNNVDTAASSKPKAADASTPVKSIAIDAASITPEQTLVTHQSSQSSPHRHHGHSHDDTEGMSDTSEEKLRVHPKPPVEQAPPSASTSTAPSTSTSTSAAEVKATHTSERISLARVRSGYSSGGSSGDNLEPAISPDKPLDMHLSEWRVELSAEGNLPKSVVRIEVRSTWMDVEVEVYYLYIRSFVERTESSLTYLIRDVCVCVAGRLILEGRSKKYTTG
jgi:hypothetical protein